MGSSWSPLDIGLTIGTMGMYAAGKVGYDMLIGNQLETRKQMKDAQNKATKQAEATAKQQEEATNRANQKRPDTSAIMAAAQQAAKGGAAGTMLTGPQGIDTSTLSLGKTSLLGA